MAEYAQHLLTAQPDDAGRAFSPLVELFEQLLTEARDAGLVRRELRRRRVAGVVLEVIMFNAFSTAIGGAMRSATPVTRGTLGPAVPRFWCLTPQPDVSADVANDPTVFHDEPTASITPMFDRGRRGTAMTCQEALFEPAPVFCTKSSAVTSVAAWRT